MRAGGGGSVCVRVPGLTTPRLSLGFARPSRYGFVEFEDSRDADDAVYELNGKDLCGERVIVEHARGPRRDRDGYSYGSRSESHPLVLRVLGTGLGGVGRCRPRGGGVGPPSPGRRDGRGRFIGVSPGPASFTPTWCNQGTPERGDWVVGFS